jgi:hypothetical protein
MCKNNAYLDARRFSPLAAASPYPSKTNSDANQQQQQIILSRPANRTI